MAGLHLTAARLFATAVLAFGLMAATRPAAAQIGSDRYASFVVDAGSGNILSSVNADEYRFPASLTKMMTCYMLFEALRDRRVLLQQAVPVSSWAASMSPTKLGLLPGMYVTVEQLLLGLVTKSANDAAAALGELLGGDEDRFAQMMTLRARSLGMSRTTFRNASGLPDWGQVTTARDMAMLARRLIQDFPDQYRYFSEPSFVFRGRTIWNHQRMLHTYPGADGLKTGYIEASGYNLVTSAVRSDRRLIGVVLGAASNGERDLHMAGLLDQGFERLGVPQMMARSEPAPYRVGGFIGMAQALPLQVASAPVEAWRPRAPALRGTGPAPARRAGLRRPVEPRSLQPALRPREIAAGLSPRAARPAPQGVRPSQVSRPSQAVSPRGPAPSTRSATGSFNRRAG